MQALFSKTLKNVNVRTCKYITVMLNVHDKNYANENKSLVLTGSLALIKCTMEYHKS